MGGEWMQIDCDLPEKPEVQLIVARSGVDLDTVLGRLIRFWRWVQRHTTSANVERVDAQVLAQLCGGDSEFWKVVSSSGWVEFTETGICISGWKKRFSKSSKKRALDARRQSRKRHAIVTHPRDGNVTGALPRAEVEAEQKQKQKAVLSEQQSAGPADLKNLKRLLAAERLELNDLKDTEKLIGISQKLAESGYGELDTDIGRQNFLGAAEHALHVAATKPGFKNPLGLFSAIVFDRRWDELTGEQMERSRGRIRKWQQTANGHSGAAGILANAFRSDIPTSPP